MQTEQEPPTPGIRLAAALLVGAAPALALFAGAVAVIVHEALAPSPDNLPGSLASLASLALGAAALVSMAVYFGCAVAMIITVELLALFGNPTAWRVHGWALLPGVASMSIVLDGVTSWRHHGVMATALACLLAWQVLLRLWWHVATRLARRY